MRFTAEIDPVGLESQVEADEGRGLLTVARSVFLLTRGTHSIPPRALSSAVLLRMQSLLLTF